MNFYLFLRQEEKEKLRKKKHLDILDILLEAKVIKKNQRSLFKAVVLNW